MKLEIKTAGNRTSGHSGASGPGSLDKKPYQIPTVKQYGHLAENILQGGFGTADIFQGSQPIP